MSKMCENDHKLIILDNVCLFNKCDSKGLWPIKLLENLSGYYHHSYCNWMEYIQPQCV